ncbi:MAG: hypothetical protein AAFP26_08325 [Planctomycetota bacterium]
MEPTREVGEVATPRGGTIEEGGGGEEVGVVLGDDLTDASDNPHHLLHPLRLLPVVASVTSTERFDGGDRRGEKLVRVAVVGRETLDAGGHVTPHVLAHVIERARVL